MLGMLALLQSPEPLRPGRTTKPDAVTAESMQQHDEREAVRRAVSDYVEGFYEGDTVKLARSLRPDLAKYGFWIPKDSTKYTGESMSFAQAIDYARRFKTAKRTTPADAPREITIFEVQDQTASAKLRAWWGTDYLLLGKVGGRWMISHVLWQSPPK